METGLPPTPPDPNRLAKLMEGVAICLFYYQQIEHGLKFLLPQFRDPNAEGASASHGNWRELIDAPVTLGPLAEMAKTRFGMDPPTPFHDYLVTLVRQRNHLVHHFLADPEHPVRTPEDVEAAIGKVREYMSFASPMVTSLERMAAVYMEMLDNTPEGFIPIFSIDRGVDPEGLPTSAEPDATDPPRAKPSKELRCDTRLVSLLRAGLQASSDETGWAQLAAVGSYINRAANDFDPRNYGYAKLGELIAAIGLFDVERRDTRIFVRDPRKKPPPGVSPQPSA